jgi:phosphomannomutase
MAGVFKSYDIRAIYPDPLDENLARKIGASLGRYYKSIPENASKKNLRIVVGRDARLSAPSVSAAMIEGLTKAGLDVIDIGMTSTPAGYFANQHLGADGSVQVTASHNPPEYIGFKVCRELAIPLSYDSGLNEVERTIDEPLPAGPKGSVEQADVTADYLKFLLTHADLKRPVRAAADASNGMAGQYLTELFDQLGCPLQGMFLEPDGRFPHHEADPLKPENLAFLQKLTPASRAEVGFCYDGDGDRVAMVDEQGRMIGCDIVTAIIARDVAAKNPGRPITYDLRSSKVCRDVIAAGGGKPVRVRVGHSHVKRQMKEIDGVFGGELSGHYYFKLEDKAVFYADSALVATIKLLNILSESPEPLSEIVASMQKYFHTGEINFKIDDKEAALAAVQETFQDGDQDFLDGVSVTYPTWWVNVRPSNTEPLIRLTLEGDSPELRDEKLAAVEKVLTKYGERATSGH